MTNKDLDRLLEIERLIGATNNLSEKEIQEHNFLKSQIKSKLASLQYVDDLINDFGIEKPLDLYLAETKQELSQLREQHKKIKDVFLDYEQTFEDAYYKMKDISAILASSEVKQ